MNMNVVLVRCRLGWAVLGIVALVLQGIATEMTRPGYFTHLSLFVNFFSYFTILTNLFLTIWFVLAFRSRQMGQARWWGDQPEIKGALLVAGTVTILVYWTLLVDIPIPTVTGEIANFLLHLLVPLGLWIDWLIVGDPMTKSYGVMLRAWLIFPLVFVIYTEVRGPFAHWYPYFFLDPQAVGGTGTLIVSIIGMMLLFVVVASLIFWLYQKRDSLQIVPAQQSRPI
ncbi:MAG: hypothetical protein NVS4B11_10840 [Ktedonobacteraceae bacterium]